MENILEFILANAPTLFWVGMSVCISSLIVVLVGRHYERKGSYGALDMAKAIANLIAYFGKGMAYAGAIGWVVNYIITRC